MILFKNTRLILKACERAEFDNNSFPQIKRLAEIATKCGESIILDREDSINISKYFEPRRLTEDEITASLKEWHTSHAKGKLNKLHNHGIFKLRNPVVHLLNNNEPKGQSGDYVMLVRYQHDDFFCVINLCLDCRHEFHVAKNDLMEI